MQCSYCLTIAHHIENKIAYCKHHYKLMIEETERITKGNKTLEAQARGISRATLYRKIEKKEE